MKLNKLGTKSYSSQKSLLLITLVFICLFSGLGIWQLSRAQQKKILLKSFTQRTEQAPLSIDKLKQTADARFYRTQLEGTFDNQHTFLLDNKTFHGQVGYEVYTLFHAKELKLPILVDRGFIPMGKNRKELPGIHSIIGKMSITGMLNLPPSYVALGPMQDSQVRQWPLRIEFVNLSEVGKFINQSVFPYILSVEPSSAIAYAIEWQVVTMGPERHLGYAVQWFALALSLLILSLVLIRKRS